MTQEIENLMSEIEQWENRFPIRAWTLATLGEPDPERDRWETDGKRLADKAQALAADMFAVIGKVR